MKCENCGVNPATVHTKTVLNGQITEKMLCQKCWSLLRSDFAQPFTLSDLFKGIMQPEQETAQGPECPVCGMDLRTFKKTGLLGCPDCYGAFDDVLKPNLIKIHGKARHEGKRPETANTKRILPWQSDAKRAEGGQSNEIDSLKEQLNMAVSSEQYEKAAELRDKIKQMLQTKGEGGNG